MSVRVGELVHQLRSRSRVLNTTLGNVELVADGDYAGMLRVGDEFLSWGDRTTQLLMKFLQGPGWKYVEREPLDWQRSVVKHHVDQNKDKPSVWYLEGSQLAGVYSPDSKIIPLVDVAEQVADVFDPNDWVNVLYSPDQVEINVTSNLRTVTVPGIPGVVDRPLEGTVDHPDGRKVGDLSAGGVRIKIQPGRPERAPEVEEFWERLVCTNGMTRTVPGSLIKLRGHTVEEILAEMNGVMRQIWDGLDGSAQAIQHSAQTQVPGAVSDFIRQVARERNVNASTILRLQERATTLQPNPSVYDVTQIITAMANDEGLPVLTRRSLQAIGGDNLLDTERMVHRCTQCERPLAA